MVLGFWTRYLRRGRKRGWTERTEKENAGMPLPRSGLFFVQGFVPGHEESLQESHDSEHGESERTGHQNSGPGVIKTGRAA
ncbi:hypothetical protein SHIRM173S_00172 [Streptomyces hirsutus]